MRGDIFCLLLTGKEKFMKLYIETKFMDFEDGEHELILRVSEEEFLGYDKIIESDILSFQSLF